MMVVLMLEVTFLVALAMRDLAVMLCWVSQRETPVTLLQWHYKDTLHKATHILQRFNSMLQNSP